MDLVGFMAVIESAVESIIKVYFLYFWEDGWPLDITVVLSFVGLRVRSLVAWLLFERHENHGGNGQAPEGSGRTWKDVKLYDNHCHDLSIGPPTFLSDVRLDYLQSCMNMARPPFLLTCTRNCLRNVIVSVH